jgi:hypothetical protein
VIDKIKTIYIKKILVCVILITQLIQYFHNILMENIDANINYEKILELQKNLEPITDSPLQISFTIIGILGLFLYLINTLLEKKKFMGIKQSRFGLFFLSLLLVGYFSINGNTFLEYANSLAMRNIWLCLIASIITIDFIEDGLIKDE